MPGLPEDLDRLLHDLRGPLNSAVIQLEVLKRTVGADEAARQTVQAIHADLIRLADMLATAFEVVALERTGLQPLDLHALVERALREAGLTTVTVDDGPWPQVIGDPALLALAVVHLARNAVEATQASSGKCPAPRILAEVRPDGVVDLVVRDWGVGSATAGRHRRPRLGTSTKSGRHATGLLIVQRIARLHDGALHLDAADPGTEARLTLRKR